MTQLAPILVLCGLGLLVVFYFYWTSLPGRVSDELLREWLTFLVKTTSSGKRITTTARLPEEAYDRIAIMRTPRQRAEWQEAVERLENEFAVRTLQTQFVIRKQIASEPLTQADDIVRRQEGLAGYTGEPPIHSRAKPDPGEGLPNFDLKVAPEARDIIKAQENSANAI